MKKTTTLTIALLLYISTIKSQTFYVDYLYNPSSGNCIEEKYQIQFKPDIYYRIDYYDNSKVWSPSRKSNSGYNEQDLYYEVWSPRFYLDLVGIDEYKRVYHYLVKVIYDKKGGSVLYVIEQNLEYRNRPSKYFVTKLGAKYFCEN